LLAAWLEQPKFTELGQQGVEQEQFGFAFE